MIDSGLNPEALQSICDMGFPLEQARWALQAAKGDVSVAIGQLCGEGAGGVSPVRVPVSTTPLARYPRLVGDEDDDDAVEDLPPFLENWEELIEDDEVSFTAVVEELFEHDVLDLRVDGSDSFLHKAVQNRRWDLALAILDRPEMDERHRKMLYDLITEGDAESLVSFVWAKAFPPKTRAAMKQQVLGGASVHEEEEDDGELDDMIRVLKRMLLIVVGVRKAKPIEEYVPLVLKKSVRTLNCLLHTRKQLDKKERDLLTVTQRQRAMAREMEELRFQNERLRARLAESEVVVVLSDDGEQE